MGFHGVDLLRLSVKLCVLATLGFSSRASFFVFVWPLHSVLVRVILRYFTLLWGVSGSMQQSCFLPVGQLLWWPASIFLWFTKRPLKRILLPFVSCHYWYGWNLPLWCFYKGVPPLKTCSKISIHLNIS